MRRIRPITPSCSFQVVQETRHPQGELRRIRAVLQGIQPAQLGPGISQEHEHRIKVAQQQEDQKIQQDLKQQFLTPSTNNNTATDDFFKSIRPLRSRRSIKYTGDEMANL